MDIPYIAQVAALVGLLAPLVIVGTGVALGLTISISKVMLGMVLGMIELFVPSERDDDF